MRKLLRNIHAYIKGGIIKIIHPTMIKGKIRVFKGTSIRIYKGSKLQVYNNAKIDENAVIAVLRTGILTIEGNVGVGPNDYIVCHKLIFIGEGAILGPNVYIYDHDHTFTKNEGVDAHKYNCGEVVIGKNCWIGANTVILKGTRIGDNCIIGAGSVLKGNYPSGSVIIQKRETEIHSITK